MKERKKKKKVRKLSKVKYCHLGLRKKKEKKDGRPLFRDKDYSFTALQKKQTSKTLFLLSAKAITLQLFQVKHSEIIFLSYLPCFQYYILENRITHINIIICNRQSICFFWFQILFWLLCFKPKALHVICGSNNS